MADNGKDAIIRLFHVGKQYGAKFALTDLTLDIYPNEFLFVTGPSGAGKTTLLKLLYLGETATEGQIIIDGINLARIPQKSIPPLRRRFGIIFQDYKLIPTRTIYDNVGLVLEALGQHRKMIDKRIRLLLRTVGMEDRAKALPPSLSGGEQQRVAVARAVAGNPDFILADEPTGNLDADSAAIIFDLLAQFHARGATLLIATHDMHLVEKYSSRTIHLKEGRLC